MDTQNCIICQNPAIPGHDFDENGPLFMNFTKILKSSSTSCSNFDLNEFKSLTLNGHYVKICSTCNHQLVQFDTLTCQLHNLQLKINEICTVIKNKAVQSQQFRKGNIWLPNADVNGHLEVEVESSFDAEAGANINDSMPDFDFNFDSIENHGVDEIDAKVNIKVESPSSTSAATLNLTSNFQLQLIGPHVNETNDDNLDIKSKEEIFGLKKKVKIFLKRIQLPCTNGPYNIKDLKIANFIQKDRERIRKYKNSLREEKRNKRRREARALKRKIILARKVQDPRKRIRIRSKNTGVPVVRNFVCTYENCSKSFYTKSNYDDHFRIHTGECPFICEICARTFRSEPVLKSHFTIVHNNSDQNQSKIKCPEPSCGISCNSQKRLDKHILEIHKDGLKRYLCEQCPRSFNEIGGLNDHIKCYHKGEFYKCPYPNCKSKLTSSYSFKTHIQKVHEKIAKFFCSDSGCKKGFFTKSDRDSHFKAKHLGEEFYEFGCDYGGCTRRFMLKRSLEVHKLMVHLNERPYKCSTCPKAFARPRALQEHEILHTGIRDFICTYENCGQAYAVKSLLGEHIRKHHKNPDKWLSKNVQNRKGFRRRVNRVEIIKDNNDNDQNQIQNLNE